MVTSLYTADVKLNPADKDFHRMLVIHNPEEGVLLVNKGLFNISFETEEAFLTSDVEIKDKRHIGDINL